MIEIEVRACERYMDEAIGSTDTQKCKVDVGVEVCERAFHMRRGFLVHPTAPIAALVFPLLLLSFWKCIGQNPTLESISPPPLYILDGEFFRRRILIVRSRMFVSFLTPPKVFGVVDMAGLRAELESVSGYISYGSVLATEPTMAEDPVIRMGSSPGRQLQHQCEYVMRNGRLVCRLVSYAGACVVACVIKGFIITVLLARGECCTFSNAEYMKSGLDELEVWCGHAQEFVGPSWDELKHVWQVVRFLMIPRIQQKMNNSWDE
ncbi:myosin-8 [Phtheirospermum japonicum]|uniref:Myosin-8 n=1 Tax=Phtheirospermum japonicum TaxID=374723 RepID=A0A830CT26_9LAMI|nr:myosin-8 [Phtheirospermum japonicum]